MNVYYVVANGTLVTPVSFCEKHNILASVFCLLFYLQRLN